jgi:PAS domain S-box-containing protein
MEPPEPAHRNVVFETACALAEFTALTDASPRVLRTVCQTLHWDCGALWECDRARHVMRCVATWPEPARGLDEFLELTRSSTFPPGRGLPGRVWSEERPFWIAKVFNDANFPRGAAAERAGLLAALGLPIAVDGRMLGVIEFFSREIRKPDPDLMRTLTTVCSLVGQFMDRHRAAEELDRFFTLSLDLLCVANFEGYFLRVNHSAWQRVLGFSLDELRTAPFLDFVHPDDRESTQAAMADLSKGVRVIGFENRYRTRDGSYKWLQWTSVPYPDQGLIYATARDVTERRHTAEALAEAKRRAEEATIAKGEFLANMSHEVRTPMNAIIGMTDLALETDLTATQRDYIETVKASAEALLTIVNDILDMSKIEARRLVLDRAPFNIRDAVENAVRLLAPRAHEKGLELAAHIRPDVPDAAVGDRGRLRQVLVNLVGNAIKFTDQGEVIVDVAVEHAGPEVTALKFTVSDTGIGIPLDKQWQVFGPFVQADASTTRRFGGTGLGLTISAQLVELMGGRIWVESEPGRGSRFHFVAQFGTQAQPVAGTPPAAILEGLRVLIVDDNATNRTILREMLTGWRIQSTAVAGAVAAMDALYAAADDGRPFQLVITDAMMPDVDGFTLAEQIGRDERISDVKLIMLTSAAVSHAAQGSRGRFDAQLTKPVKQSDLHDAIVSVMAPALSPATARGDAERRPPPLLPLQVLVAEDNPTNQKLVATLLQRRGHDVTIVANGRDAVDRALRRRFDLILMDVQMPEMNGLEAAEEIRRREGDASGGPVRGRTPIVALTAHAMAGDRERCLAAGMDGYLAKPLRPDELMATIESLFPSSARAPEDNDRAAPAASERQRAFDAATVLAEFGGDRSLLAEVIDVFLADAPARLAELSAALAARDRAALATVAHAMKGSVGLFSRGPAYEGAIGLMQRARAGDLAGASVACAALERDVRALLDELEAFRKAL